MESVISLIHSLNSTEKKFVSQWLKRKKKNSHIYILYKYIEQHKNLSHKDISSWYASHFPSGNITVVTRRLFDSILTALRMLHYQKTKELELLSQLQDVTLLIDHGLFNEANVLLQKILDQAELLGLFGIAMHCLHLRMRLSRRNHSFPVSYKDFNIKGNQVISQCLRWLNNATSFLLAYDTYYRSGGRITIAQQKNRYEDAQKLLQVPKDNDSILTKYLYVQTSIILEGVKQEFTDHLPMVKDLFKQMFSNDVVRDTYGNLLSSLTLNLLISLVDRGMVDDAQHLIKLLEELFLKTRESNSSDVGSNYVAGYLYFLQVTKQMPDPNFENTVFKVIKHLDIAQWRYAYIHYILATLYFYNRSWDKALKWLKPFLTHGKRKQSIRTFYKDFSAFAYLLTSIIYYETGKIDQMEKTIRKCQYIFQQMDIYRTSNTLKFVIGFIKNMVFKEPTERRWRELFKILQSAEAEEVLRYVDLLTWIKWHQPSIT